MPKLVIIIEKKKDDRVIIGNTDRPIITVTAGNPTIELATSARFIEIDDAAAFIKRIIREDSNYDPD